MPWCRCAADSCDDPSMGNRLVGFTTARGLSTELNVLADPDRVRRLDLAGVLD